MQTFAVTAGDLEDALVAYDVEHFFGAVVQHGATVALAKVVLDVRTQAGIDVAIDEVRQFSQDFFAGHHGFLPLQTLIRSSQLFPKTGANCSRICKRARCRRVFTDGMLMPSALAVSSTVKC